jgi:GWxTD domain-containing protein
MFSKLWCFIFSLLPLWLEAIPDASVAIHRFRAGDQSFAEISLYLVGSSLRCQSEHNEEYGIEYMVIIRNNESNVVGGNRYRLSNHGCPARDLIDVKRFSLTPGVYDIEIEMRDINDSLSNGTVIGRVQLDDPFLHSRLSDVQLLSKVRSESEVESALHKSGLYIEPLPFSYYYPQLHQLISYVETYQMQDVEGQPYLQYTLKPLTGDIPSPMVAYRKVEKQTIGAHVFQLDIDKLISGMYLFEVSLFDGNKKLINTQTATFSRFSPKADSIYIAEGYLNLDGSFIINLPEDSLDYYMKAMAPVVNSIYVDIINTLLQKGDSRSKRFFIHRYWTEEAGKFAHQAFSAYMNVARAVDANYRSGFGYGFETDRGHIFMKYGRPDDIISVEDEPSAPPYEIWYYYHFPATHQTNVRFLFYNPSLAKNAYQLLHSTALGEMKNERWEVELYKDATLETPGVNEKVMGDNVHRNARKYFENY